MGEGVRGEITHWPRCDDDPHDSAKYEDDDENKSHGSAKDNPFFAFLALRDELELLLQRIVLDLERWDARRFDVDVDVVVALCDWRYLGRAQRVESARPANSAAGVHLLRRWSVSCDRLVVVDARH